MSDSDNEENPDMIELTLNYENKRADEEIDDTFNDGDLEKFCQENFGIDINKYDIQFYYFDKKSNQKTPIIPDCISSFYDPYKFNKGNNDRLMLYVETKLKEDLQKKLEEAKNEYTKICKDIDSLNKEKYELEKEIKKIKELIEQENKPDDEDDDDDDEKELNEYESKKENIEKRTKEMELEKSKEIEDLKEENLKLEKMIADLSLKLSKQKEENQNLKKENENLQKNINELNQDQINSSSLSFNSNELSLSNANFFSDKNEIQNYMGNNENKIKQKEKKKERLTKINELYQKMKNDNTKFKLRKKDTSELGLRSSNSLSLSRVNSRISGEIKNNKKVENIQLKKDITVLEEKINSMKNDIENLKTMHENQVKNIKNTQI